MSTCSLLDVRDNMWYTTSCFLWIEDENDEQGEPWWCSSALHVTRHLVSNFEIDLKFLYDQSSCAV